MTTQPTPDQVVLPQDLLREVEKVAEERGRDVEAVVAAAVRRYLWDTTFRTLRKAARDRASAQGVASDEAVLTSVLAVRRPDEFRLEKPGIRAGALVADEEEDEEPESRAATPAPERTAAVSGGTTGREPERRRRRRGRGRGAEERTAPEAPRREREVPTAAVESLRRRVESVHRFLPPEEPEELEAEPAAPWEPAESAPAVETPPSPSRRPFRESPLSEAVSPPSPPESPASSEPLARPPEPPRERPRDVSPPPEPPTPSAPAMAYGRRPKRGSRR